MINLFFNLKELGQMSWKTIVALLFIIVAIFAIFGLIGRAVELIIDQQARKLDRFMSPLIVSGLIDDEKEFAKIAMKKTRIYFFKTSILPILLMLCSILIFVIYHSIVGRWNESIFNDVSGIGTLFYTFDFSNAAYYPPLGVGGVTIQNYPHFLTDERMINYFIFLFGIVGIIRYLLNVQGYIARSLRIKKLRDKMFSQNLDNIDLATIFNGNFSSPTNLNNNDKN